MEEAWALHNISGRRSLHGHGASSIIVHMGRKHPVTGAPWEKMRRLCAMRFGVHMPPMCMHCPAWPHQRQHPGGPRHGERCTTVAGKYPPHMCSSLAPIEKHTPLSTAPLAPQASLSGAFWVCVECTFALTLWRRLYLPQARQRGVVWLLLDKEKARTT